MHQQLSHCDLRADSPMSRSVYDSNSGITKLSKEAEFENKIKNTNGVVNTLDYKTYMDDIHANTNSYGFYMYGSGFNRNFNTMNSYMDKINVINNYAFFDD